MIARISITDKSHDAVISDVGAATHVKDLERFQMTADHLQDLSIDHGRQDQCRQVREGLQGVGQHYLLFRIQCNPRIGQLIVCENIFQNSLKPTIRFLTYYLRSTRRVAVCFENECRSCT